MHGDRVQHLLDRARRRRSRQASSGASLIRWKTSNVCPFGAAVLVDRHRRPMLASDDCGTAMTRDSRSTPPQRRRTPLAGAVRALARRRFWLGVAAVTAAPAAFLVHQLMAWPPHEDETLALFVGRRLARRASSSTSLDERGGAPLHFLLAWAVAHLGRRPRRPARSSRPRFAVASLPLVALLGAPARRAAAPRSSRPRSSRASWMFLFHGVYGRMYSLFLLLAPALVPRAARARSTAAAAGRGRSGCSRSSPSSRRTRTARSCSAARACSSSGARRDRLREAALAVGAVARARHPVLAHRPRARRALRRRRRRRRGEARRAVRRRSRTCCDVAGDFSAGCWPVALACAGAGGARAGPLWRTRRDAAALALCARRRADGRVSCSRSSAAPRRRSRATSSSCCRSSRSPSRPGSSGSRATRVRVLVPLVLSALLVARGRRGRGTARRSSSSGSRTTPGGARARPRRTSRRRAGRDDVLFGYDPLFLGAWERDGDFPAPSSRARTRGSRSGRCARRSAPLGRGVWVLDASEREQRQPAARDRDCASPSPAADVRGARVRAVPRHPHRRADANARDATSSWPRRAMLRRTGRSQIGDADVNLLTIERGGRGRARLRAVALPLDDLAVAGRVLEGGEPGRRRAAARARPQPAGGRDRRGGPDEAAEHERAQPVATPLRSSDAPWTIVGHADLHASATCCST